MRPFFVALGAAALAATLGPARGLADPSSERAVLHFADMHGIMDWRVDETSKEDAILIEGRNGEWYRATFWGPCPEVRFTPAIAFVTDTLGNLDQFTSIIADGRQCHFRTFERTSDPDERKATGGRQLRGEPATPPETGSADTDEQTDAGERTR